MSSPRAIPAGRCRDGSVAALRWCALGASLVLLGCGDIDRTLVDGVDGGNGDADSDTDSDADSDTDADTDGDTEENHGWDVGDCQEDVTPTGGPLQIGDVVPNFTLLSQFGDFVTLYDYCHKTVLVDFVAATSASCSDEAPTNQQWYEAYADDGFIVLTVLTEGWFTDDFGGSQPNLNDLNAWVEIGGATHPVLSDPNAVNYLLWETEAEAIEPGYSWPRKRLMSPGMVIEAMYPDPDLDFDEQTIEDLLFN